MATSSEEIPDTPAVWDFIHQNNKFPEITLSFEKDLHGRQQLKSKAVLYGVNHEKSS